MASIFFLLASLSLAFLCICQADLISDVCSKSHNPSLCTQTLKSDPRSRSPAVDLTELGQIIIEKSEAATQDFIGVVKLISTVKTKRLVDVCVEISKDAIRSLKDCSKYLKEAGGKGDIQKAGSLALTNVGTCDDVLGDSETPKVKEASKRAQDLIDVLVVIANKL